MVPFSPISRLRHGALAVSLCLVLSACENPWMDEAPTLDEILSDGWLFGDKEAVAPPPTVAPIYCYETIGVGDCHERPLEDGGNRLIGFQGPPPEAYLQTYPLPLMP